MATASDPIFSRFIKRVSGLVLLALATVFTFNLIVDPFNKVRLLDLNLPKSDVAYKMHYPLYKSIEYSTKPQPVLILGDSRADALRPSYFEEVGKRHVYNMSYGGGSLPEMIDSFWFATQFGVLEEVYFGLPFNLYTSRYRSNRLQEIESMREDVLPYYFSWLVTKASFLTLGSALKGESLKSERPTSGREAFWREQLGSTTARYYGNWEEPLAEKKALIEIARYCNEHDIRLVFFIPPTHTDLQEKVTEFDLEHERKQFAMFLSSLGLLMDFDFVNNLTADASNFKDPYHAVAPFNKKVVSALALNKEDAKELAIVKTN